jgi:hypothetical protein
MKRHSQINSADISPTFYIVLFLLLDELLSPQLRSPICPRPAVDRSANSGRRRSVTVDASWRVEWRHHRAKIAPKARREAIFRRRFSSIWAMLPLNGSRGLHLCAFCLVWMAFNKFMSVRSMNVIGSQYKCWCIIDCSWRSIRSWLSHIWRNGIGAKLVWGYRQMDHRVVFFLLW